MLPAARKPSRWSGAVRAALVVAAVGATLHLWAFPAIARSAGTDLGAFTTVLRRHYDGPPLAVVG